MNTKQLNAALKIAQDSNVRFIDDNGKHLEDITIFDGFGLPSFQPVTVTLRQLAFLIRWQVSHIMGDGHDSAALQEIASIGRRKFTIVGEGA